MTYTVKYRTKGRLFFRRIRNVKGDGIVKEVPFGVRYFITKDEARYEVAMEGTEFVFGRERHDIIRENMRRESGVTV